MTAFAPAGEVERILHPVDLGGVVQPAHVRVEPEAGRAFRRLVAARAFEDAAAVVDDVRGDVDLGVLPVHQLAVHPDLARPGKAMTAAPFEQILALGSAQSEPAGSRSSSLRDQRSEPRCQRSPMPRYCASPQNGQRSERACSGLRQCQQKRGCGVSRALRRDWMSCDLVGADGRRRRRRRSRRRGVRCRARPAHRRAGRRRAGSAPGSPAPAPSARCR